MSLTIFGVLHIARTNTFAAVIFNECGVTFFFLNGNEYGVTLMGRRSQKVSQQKKKDDRILIKMVCADVQKQPQYEGWRGQSKCGRPLKAWSDVVRKEMGDLK